MDPQRHISQPTSDRGNIPPPPPPRSSTRDAAANVVRHQIDHIYANDDGPMATQQNGGKPQISQNPYEYTHAPTSNTTMIGRSPQHQITMDRAEAQRKYHSAWQNYYQKYYEKYYIAQMQNQQKRFEHQQASVTVHDDAAKLSTQISQTEVMDDLRTDLLAKVRKNAAKVRKSKHFWPIVSAILVILILLFIQFNQIIFATVGSFVSPGQNSDQTIIVGSGDNVPVSQDPRIIIPKINIDAPVIYDLPSLTEADVQKALEQGVVHYPLPGANSVPGQNGNSVFLGHSSGDLFSNGNFKFVFVQLSRMEKGDVFYLNYNGVRYTYEVTGKEIIAPTQIDKLNLGDDAPYATLITCDPPGTALNRLVVYAKQVNPDPAKATAPQSTQAPSTNQITGNNPTLFERIFRN